MQNRRFSWAFLVLLIALAPLIAGCGLFGDDEGDDVDTDTDDQVVETPVDGDDAATEEPEETEMEGTPEAEGTPDDASPAPSDGTPEADGTPQPEGTPQVDQNVGQQIFSEVCAACHQPEGQGVEGIYPPLAGSPFVTLDDPAPVIQTILTGRGGMPRFADAYTNEQIAAIVTYIRTNLGNNASEVSPQQVEEVRQSLGQDTEEETGESGSGQREDPELTPTETN